MRCCVYKERAILAERVKLAAGGDKSNPNVIEVIDIACDDCPAGGYEVSDACRGCLAHRCEDVCPRAAISFDEHNKAHIDKSKCVNCGKCAEICPYSAVVNRKRPCETPEDQGHLAGRHGSAVIDNDKCISCAPAYTVPLRSDIGKSFMLTPST